jgi:hypothetical protein
MINEYIIIILKLSFILTFEVLTVFMSLWTASQPKRPASTGLRLLTFTILRPSENVKKV